MLTILTATITSALIAYRQEEIRDAGDESLARKLDEIGRQLETMTGELRGLRAASAAEDAPAP